MAAAQLHQEEVRDLVKSQGPCVTILLPPFVPGAPTLPAPAAVLKNLLDEAEAALVGRNVNRRQIDELLDPVKRLPQDPDWSKGCQWSRAIFRSTGKLGEFYVRDHIGGHVSANDRFEVLPVLPELEMPREFYLLKLSKKGAGLLRGGIELEPIALPAQVPSRMADFLMLDRPDHDRQNRASASPSMRVRFGTGTERETRQAHLHDYYRAIDRALTDSLTARRPPLLLFGVDEDTALYRSLSLYSNLLDVSIHGSPDGGMPDAELADRAFAILRHAALEQDLKALNDARERLAPARYSEDPQSIAHFASQGRVGHLFVAAESNDEELNAVAVETIRHGGVASAIPLDRLPGRVAAALRY